MSGRLELGVALPNGGGAPRAEEVLRTADAAAELGFDSVWTSEHVIVASDAPDDYRESIEGLTVLSWVAARHPHLGLGTSVVILPLHNPLILAKRAASLQLLSDGRFRLGVGVGWHEPEFRFVGADFAGRGRRADEGIHLMQALWRGESSFRGEFWSYEDASFGPLPPVEPEIWVGGGSERALQRAREADGVWHPLAPDPDDVRRALEDWPGGRITMRMPVNDAAEAGERIAALRDAGLTGAVLRFSEPNVLEAFAREVAPALRG